LQALESPELSQHLGERQVPAVRLRALEIASLVEPFFESPARPLAYHLYEQDRGSSLLLGFAAKLRVAARRRRIGTLTTKRM
jgi:hypothetical protein